MGKVKKKIEVQQGGGEDKYHYSWYWGGGQDYFKYVIDYTLIIYKREG